MKLSVVYILMSILLCFAQQICSAQDSSHFSITEIPAKYFDKVSSQASSLNGKLDRKSEKALQQFEKQKRKLQSKLSKVDSLSAANVFANVDKQYKQLTEKITQPEQKLLKYIPSLDTMSTSLKFLDQYKGALKNTKQLQTAISKVDELKSQFQKAEDIQQFLKQEQQYLKDNLQKFGGAYVDQLKALNKQAYYYSQQVKEYKETLKDERKIERKTIDLLSKTKLYKDFMKRNSMLASLFPIPSDDTNGAANLQSIAGLQTRSQVNSVLQNQMGNNSQDAMQQLVGNIQQGQGQLQQLKDKINLPGAGTNDGTMSDFKPNNNQKVKNFRQRWEIGTIFQSQRGNVFLPVSSDIGLSAGFHLNDQSIIGIGASYKMGWGQNIKHIKISNQGVGFRSFIDYKIHSPVGGNAGDLWISGGYEMNYNNEFKSVEQLKSYSAWQQSALIGLSKKIPINTKFFKNSSVKVLWDFLSYQQVPRKQPIIVRIGYSIN